MKCDAVGIEVEDYLKDRVEEDVHNLCGWKQVDLEAQHFAQFYEEGKIKLEDELNETIYNLKMAEQGFDQRNKKFGFDIKHI